MKLLLTGCDTLGRVHRLGGWHPNAQLCHSSGTGGVHMCAAMPWAWVSWWLPVKCMCGVSLSSRPAQSFGFGFSMTTYTCLPAFRGAILGLGNSSGCAGISASFSFCICCTDLCWHSGTNRLWLAACSTSPRVTICGWTCVNALC